MRSFPLKGLALVFSLFLGIDAKKAFAESQVVETPHELTPKVSLPQGTDQADRRSLEKSSVPSSPRFGANIGAGLIGIFIPAFGGNITCSYTPRLQFLGLMYRGNRDMGTRRGGSIETDDYHQITDLKLSSSMIGLSARYFGSESFALTGGIGYRIMDVQYTVETKSTPSDLAPSDSIPADYSYRGGTYSIRALTANLSLGNYWKFGKRLTYGLTWFGIVYDLFQGASDGFKAAFETTREQLAEIELIYRIRPETKLTFFAEAHVGYSL
jgi:hypothetical protein